MLASKLERHLTRDSLLLAWQIAFVSRESHHESSLLISCILYHLINPILYCIERSLICQIVADYSTDSVSIVQVNHRAELFSTARVPNVQLNLLIRPAWLLLIRNVDDFLHVSTANGHIVQLIKSVLAET